MTDQQIIGLLRTDKTDKALAALYRHFPMVHKLIRSKGGTTQDAEDVFLEALIILCRKVADTNFLLTSQLSTYLFSVCRFLWKDQLKKRKHFTVTDFDTGLNAAEEENLDRLLEEETKIVLAEKVLAELGERCRELLLLFYKTGLALRDIAARMGYSSENTAKNQKYKCLEGAKSRLKELKQTIQTF